MSTSITEFFSDTVMPKLDAFTNNHIVKAIQTGMMAPMSAMMIGSIFSILMTPPVPPGTTDGFFAAWQAWATANASWLNIGYAFSMNFIGIYSLVGIVLALAKLKGAKPTNLVILSLMTFFMLCSGLVQGERGATVDATYLGSSGIFSAMIVGIAVVYLAGFLGERGIKIKLPPQVPPNVAEPIEGLIVNIIVVAVALGVRLGLAAFGLSLPSLLNIVFQPLLSTSDTVWAVIIYILVLRGLWFFGIHGGSVTGAIMNPILTANMAANIEAYAAGQPLPYIFTNSFSQAMLNVGMIPLVVAMFIVCRSEQLKAIRNVGLVPSLFSIGEPITFGVPIVLNFKLLIPYLGGFLISGVGFYLLTAAGIINRTMVSVPFTMPGPIKAFLACMDWRAAVAWFVLMAICTVLYIPFLKSYDNDLVKQEQGEA